MRKICIRCGKKFNTNKLKARVCPECQKERKRLNRQKYGQEFYKSPYREIGINARHLHS
jgi:predicted  nucleic acid-binding Zn-ribbon protein